MSHYVSKLHQKNKITYLINKIEDLPAEKIDETIDQIAHSNGDDFADTILKHLSPLKIAAILTQADYTTPSIISTILSPELVVDVLKRLPLFWMHIEDHERSDHFQRFQAESLDQMLNFTQNEDAQLKHEKIFEEISLDELGCNYLLLAFWDWKPALEQMSLFEHHDTEFGTSDQLFENIRWRSPYLAETVLQFVYNEEMSLKDIINDLYTEALDQFLKSRTYHKIEKQMFTPPSGV